MCRTGVTGVNRFPMAMRIPSDNAAKVGDERLVAFARDFLQRFDIQDSNFAVVIIDKSGLPQPLGDQRDATSVHAQYLRQQFLGQRQKIRC
jgi:hypothetical protein